MPRHYLTLSIALLTAALTAASARAEGNPCETYGLTIGKAVAPENVPAEIRAHYHQTQYLPVDPFGDYVLAALAKNTPKVIALSLRDSAGFAASRKKIDDAANCAYSYFSFSDPFADSFVGGQASEGARPPYKGFGFLPTQRDFNLLEKAKLTQAEGKLLLDELMSGQIGIESSKNPISVRGMNRMLLRVLQEESENGLEITQGEPHRWSQAFLAAHKKEFIPYTWMSKPLVALARGETVKYMLTGFEDKLGAWISSQPDESVTHPEIFRASLRLTHGNVYLGLLTIENLLAKSWMNPNRENLPFVQKLSRFTNYLGANEDRFGHWYHFWGIVLYGYLKGPASATLVGTLETAGSQIMGHFAREQQETAINAKAGRVGARFAKTLRRDWKSIPTDATDISPENYLKLDEDFSRRLHREFKKAEKNMKKSAISGA